MNQAIKRFLLWPLVSLFLLLAIARLSFAPLAMGAINNWFEQPGIDSEIADLSLELGQASLVLTGLRASRETQPVLKLEELRFGWSWSALFDSQFIIESLALTGFELEVEQNADAIKDKLARRIDAARLVICASEHREGGGLGGVEISI